MGVTSPSPTPDLWIGTSAVCVAPVEIKLQELLLHGGGPHVLQGTVVHTPIADNRAGGYLNEGRGEIFCQFVVCRRAVGVPDVVAEVAIVIFFRTRFAYVKSELSH